VEYYETACGMRLAVCGDKVSGRQGGSAGYAVMQVNVTFGLQDCKTAGLQDLRTA